MAKAAAKRSNRIDRAVSGDAPPPELESPPDTVPDKESPCSSSRDISDDICASCNWIKQGISRKMEKEEEEKNTQIKLENVSTENRLQ